MELGNLWSQLPNKKKIGLVDLVFDNFYGLANLIVDQILGSSHPIIYEGLKVWLAQVFRAILESIGPNTEKS